MFRGLPSRADLRVERRDVGQGAMEEAVDGLVEGGGATWPFTFSVVVGGTIFVLFFQAVGAVHVSLQLVNMLLWKRLARRPEWDDLW